MDTLDLEALTDIRLLLFTTNSVAIMNLFRWSEDTSLSA